MLTGSTDTNKKCVTLIGCYDSANLAHVLHGIVEEHEVHHRIHIVVLAETLMQSVCQCLLVGELIIEPIVERSDELSEDQRFWRGAEILLEVEL